MLPQLSADARRGHEDAACGPMEPADVAPEPVAWQAGALGQIVGKLGVVGGGEFDAMLHAVMARRQPQRAFGRDMDGIRGESTQARGDRRRTRQREPDFGICRARHAAKGIGRDDHHIMAQSAQMVARRGERADHAVHLREPRVGDDGNPLGGNGRPLEFERQALRVHAACMAGAACAAFSASRLAISSGQWRISMVPSKCSTSAVQPSTQSPSL